VVPTTSPPSSSRAAQCGQQVSDPAGSPKAPGLHPRAASPLKPFWHSLRPAPRRGCPLPQDPPPQDAAVLPGGSNPSARSSAAPRDAARRIRGDVGRRVLRFQACVAALVLPGKGRTPALLATPPTPPAQLIIPRKTKQPWDNATIHRRAGEKPVAGCRAAWW